jgi:polysaccharide transporter, PST family
VSVKFGKASRTVAKNTFFNALAGVVIQCLSVVTGIFIARSFGVAGYGDLSFAKSLTGILMMGTDFGITKIAIRKASVDSQNYGRYLLTYLITRLALSFLAYGALFVITLNADFSATSNLLILLYGLLIFANVFSVKWVFTAHQRMEFKSLSEVIDKMIYILFIFSFYFAFKTIFIVPVSMVLSLALATCLEWYILKKKFPGFKLALDKTFMKELFIYSWPVGLSSSASLLNSNLDSIFLKLYHGSVLTGEFNAAHRLITFIIMLGSFFTMSLYPLMCERATGPKEVLEKTMNKSTRYLVSLIVPILFGFTVIGPKMLVLLFGESFAGGGIILQILVWTTVFVLLGRLFGNLLTALNKQNVFMVIMVISVGIKTSLNFALIPAYQLIGVGISALVTEFMIFFSVFLVLRKEYELKIVSPFFKSICAGAVMAICLIKLEGLNLFLLIGIAPFVYFPVLALLGGITKKDRALISSIIGEYGQVILKRINRK